MPPETHEEEADQESLNRPADDETANKDERELIEDLISARATADKLEKDAKDAKKLADDLEQKLIRLLEDDDKRSSAKYEGLGHVTIIDGATYASIEKGRKPEVMEFLKTLGRDDLIETTVQSAKLSTFVRECLSKNDEVPPDVTYYNKRWLNFYPVK